MRKDVLTNEMVPKRLLVRIVRNKEGEVSVDATGKKPGRGAYVGLDPQAVKQAASAHTLDKILKVKLSAEFYQELYDYVDHQKARLDLFGELGKKH
ncbi:YlxR family protein [Bombilactobacillus folatiphilus]|uniref:YlxR family protein n=2 Tax=Bombilactobacillus folatiphilus TaxID=2923362 RepID=A0ABY4PAW8_9LACO|nr:YlxR family protein [Bombilactobacillus folatiphilus]UQS82903.1 YlxR family protein [Bombilactobacillus folatiphilus]